MAVQSSLAKLGYLYKIPYGVVKDCYRGPWCFCWLHCEFHAEFFQPLTLFLDIINEEHCLGNALPEDGFLVGSGCGVVVWAEL